MSLARSSKLYGNENDVLRIKQFYYLRAWHVLPDKKNKNKIKQEVDDAKFKFLEIKIELSQTRLIDFILINEIEQIIFTSTIT